MDKFNLDIDKYSCDDLIELLSLKSSYTENNIQEAKKKLQLKLIKMDNPDFNKINNILLFLDNAENKLTDNLKSKHLTGTYEDPENNVSLHGSHVIINNNNEIEGKKAKTWDGKNAEDNVYPPGYINPINIKTIKKDRYKI